MSLEDLKEFFKIFTMNPEAAKLIDKAFSEECEQSEECRACVETKVNYWYMKWLFGVLADPVRAARDIASCVEQRRSRKRGFREQGELGRVQVP